MWMDLSESGVGVGLSFFVWRELGLENLCGNDFKRVLCDNVSGE